MRLNRSLLAPLLILGIPLVIYTFHAARFGSWIVDDAGITFAYTRSFAQGYGLVSQPGMTPVEGYSNTAWLLLLAPFFPLRLFDPVATAKIVSGLLVAASFLVIYRALKPLPERGWAAFTALTLTALNTSFVAWTISGLENPLYFLLVCLMLWQSIRIAYAGQTRLRNALLLGGLVALAGMTRPDGIAYAAAFPLIMLPARRISWKRKFALLLMYGAAAAAVYGGFIAFRLAYFGALLPNTYTMKGGPEPEDALALLTLQPEMLEKMQGLLRSLLGSLSDLLPVLLGLLSIVLLAARRWKGQFWAVLVFLLGALAIYALLPPDWMGEYRFATAFFPLFYLFGGLVLAAALQRLPKRAARAALLVASVAAVGASVPVFSPRTETFAMNATAPFDYIRTEYANRFNDYQAALGLNSASVLLPDVGAMLYYSNLRVYDLAGLTDRTVAQTLGRHIDRPGFYEYVFETVQPTFIHMHGFWTRLARLEADPRFAALYTPICSYTDPWIEQTYRVSVQSGDFVLRSVAEAQPETVERLREMLDENCALK